MLSKLSCTFLYTLYFASCYRITKINAFQNILSSRKHIGSSSSSSLSFIVKGNEVDGDAVSSGNNNSNIKVAKAEAKQTVATPTSSNNNDKHKTKEIKKKTLKLLTFDLDDTLYPIAPVLNEANKAFASAMIKYGFGGISPNDIVEASKEIRKEMARKKIVLSHTQVREVAIRREMENVIFKQKLKQTADTWATQVSSLSPVIVNHAKKWASRAVSESVVEAVLNAWEMERHHAAERNLYYECVDVFEQIRKDNPDAIIGAVTDGKANPLFMTFTLAKYFDFCISWEDDQEGRTNFFQELNDTNKTAELKWIYNAAFEKYKELSDDGMLERGTEGHTTGNTPEKDTPLWIHVGDDLAYDVGGSSQCGAKTILVELEKERYKQTARFRFNDDSNDDKTQPNWSTNTKEELKQRKKMNDIATTLVDKKIEFLTLLPEAISDIVIDENVEVEKEKKTGKDCYSI